MRKLVLLLGSTTLFLSAQTADNPFTSSLKRQYTNVKNNVIRSAEKMGEENYGFKAVPEVRSFGQLIGHVADANFRYCGMVIGGQPPAGGVEKSKTTKVDLVQAVKDSFAYCDKAYDAITDATAVEKAGAQERPKFAILESNNMHDNEHYGNMVTYLRLKGIVPPSSDRR